MLDEEVSKPWEGQKSFGAGIMRKTIHFVPAAVVPTQPIQTIQLEPRTPLVSPGDRYLNIVLKKGASTEDRDSTPTEISNHEKNATPQQLDLEGAFCEICNLPIDAREDTSSTAATSHESTIAHMVCLTHSHPLSHLDRSRQGLRYLSSFGWDPDARQGLGATGEGIKVPIKARIKNDTLGLGVKMKGKKGPPETKVERMDGKQARKKDIEDRRKREMLQEMFYGNEDVEKYLGGG